MSGERGRLHTAAVCPASRLLLSPVHSLSDRFLFLLVRHRECLFDFDDPALELLSEQRSDDARLSVISSLVVIQDAEDDERVHAVHRSGGEEEGGGGCAGAAAQQQRRRRRRRRRGGRHDGERGRGRWRERVVFGCVSLMRVCIAIQSSPVSHALQRCLAPLSSAVAHCGRIRQRGAVADRGAQCDQPQHNEAEPTAHSAGHTARRRTHTRKLSASSRRGVASRLSSERDPQRMKENVSSRGNQWKLGNKLR